jgi:hypothetical protein
MTNLAVAYVPREPRWECDFDVVIVDEIGRELIGRVANISEGGFMAECEEKFRLGEIVRVTLPGRGQVSAEVRWAVGWRFGAMILAD